MNSQSHTTENFTCVKCRGRIALVRKVSLATQAFSIFSLPSHYVTVTCSLCGYTELYDARLYAQASEQAPAEHPLLEKN